MENYMVDKILLFNKIDNIIEIDCSLVDDI